MKAVALAVSIVMMFTLNFKSIRSFADTTVEQRAEYAGMTVDDFTFISSVVEAESNRRSDEEAMLGRVYISLVILNRVYDDRFPNTISGVLTQSGQFSTVRNGHSVTNRTDLSDQAVIEAVQWMNSGEDYPWLLFFNCRGYATGSYYTGYACVAGNYFSIAEPSLPSKLMEGGAAN